MLYPWQHQPWQKLRLARQQDRLPHALLLAGAEGCGRREFARELAWSLLCEQPEPDDDLACGQCRACRLLAGGNHPDLLGIHPAEEGKAIKIDQVRGLIEFFSLTPNYGGYQIALLQPAEAMNHNAANSLLKLLEEPPPRRLLLLVSAQPAQLPATVRSRCQRVDFRPGIEEGRAWLRENPPANAPPVDLLLTLSGGAPLRALELADRLPGREQLLKQLKKLLAGQADPVRTAEDWEKQGSAEILYWIQICTMDLIRCRMAGIGHLVNSDLADGLASLAEKLEPRGLFHLLEKQAECGRLLGGPTNVKDQTLLEAVALHWMELGKQGRKA